MAKTPKKNKDELSSALSSLREDIRHDVLGISESLEELKTSTSPNGDESLALANSIQALRQELRHETSNLSQLIEQAQLEQAQSDSVAPELDTSQFSNAVDSLRGELRREVQGLSQTIARNEPQRKGPPLLTVFAALAGFVIGILGTMLYYKWTPDNPDQLAAFSAKLDGISGPRDEQLKEHKDLLETLVGRNTNDNSPQAVALDELTTLITDLKTQVEAQDTQIKDSFTAVKDDLANEVSRIVAAEMNILAKPAVPEAAEESESEASQEADNTDVAKDEPAGSAAGEAKDPPLDRVVNKVQSPVQAKLIIDNPSRFDINLLVNDEVVKVAARGITTVPVTQGSVKTQTAGIPETAQQWNDWQTIEGEVRLKIKVDADGNSYILR